MPPILPKIGKRVILTIEEKSKILDFIAKNPKERYENVAQIFTERYNKKLNRMAICRIKKNEDAIRNAPSTSKTNHFYDKSNIVKFEQDFLYKFNQKLRVTPMTFETAKILAVKLQRSEKYKNVDDVQKMGFSKCWWAKFQKNRGMKWKRICNKRKTFTFDEVTTKRNYQS